MGGFSAIEILARSWALRLSHGSSVENWTEWVLGSRFETDIFALDADRIDKTIVIVIGNWRSGARWVGWETVQDYAIDYSLFLDPRLRFSPVRGGVINEGTLSTTWSSLSDSLSESSSGLELELLSSLSSELFLIIDTERLVLRPGRPRFAAETMFRLARRFNSSSAMS